MGRIAKLAAQTGHRAGAYDWAYGSSEAPPQDQPQRTDPKGPMDLTSSAGFAFLGAVVGCVKGYYLLMQSRPEGFNAVPT